MFSAPDFSGSCGYEGPSASVFDGVHDKSAVCLLMAAGDAPVQLLATASLRSMLRKRLGLPDGLQPAGKRADLREVVRAVAWLDTHSRFETDLHYLRLARQYFPVQHAKLVQQNEPHFVSVDVAANHPRLQRVVDIGKARGAVFGPLQTKQAAEKWIEQVEGAFDLCRYHSILTAAPRGQACAYKDMGRCAAPCDGSISLEAYRQQVGYALTVLESRADFDVAQQRRMLAAAAEMRFEAAGRIKQFADEVQRLFAAAGSRAGGRFVRELGQFRYVSVQRGGRAKCCKVFAVSAAGVAAVGEYTAGGDDGQLIDASRSHFDASSLPTGGWDEVGVFCQYLFAPAGAKAAGGANGVILHADELVPGAIAAAANAVAKRRAQDAATPADQPAEGGQATERELLAE
jgi:hypothetical protein